MLTVATPLKSAVLGPTAAPPVLPEGSPWGRQPLAVGPDLLLISGSIFRTQNSNTTFNASALFCSFLPGSNGEFHGSLLRLQCCFPCF